MFTLNLVRCSKCLAMSVASTKSIMEVLMVRNVNLWMIEKIIHHSHHQKKKTGLKKKIFFFVYLSRFWKMLTLLACSVSLKLRAAWWFSSTALQRREGKAATES